MDYVTRQFINLTKKFRKELRQALQKHTDAIRDSTKAARENKQKPLPVPLPVVAELQTPEADKTEHRAQYEKSHRLQKWLTVGTWLAFTAAAIYAGITAYYTHLTRKTLDEITKQTPSIQQAAAAAEQSASAADLAIKNTIASFRLDQRAWVNPSFPHDTIPDNSFAFVPFQIFNNGKTPALKVRTTVIVRVIGERERVSFYELKNGNAFTSGIFFPNQPWKYGVNIFDLADNGNYKAILWTKGLRQELDSGRKHVFGYGKITYDDVFGTNHWVTFCWFLWGGFVVAPTDQHRIPEIEQRCSDTNATDTN